MVKRPLRRGQYQRGYLKLRSRSVLAERASPTKEGRTERVQGRRARYIKAGSLKWETEVTDKGAEPNSNLAGHPGPLPSNLPHTQRPEQCLALADPCPRGPAHNAEGIHNAVGPLG